jgi:hypothetical protein
MNIYDRIIENPLFFKWIFHPSPEINAYWNHYLENNPEHAEKIIELKAQIEIHLKYEEKKAYGFREKSAGQTHCAHVGTNRPETKPYPVLSAQPCVMRPLRFCF